ncbi:NAD(P)-dependent oxidoreductase [Spongiactinospora gelatinilytica]|uniref:NAD(P)-dependent oxidoreductase n=1 Tax=Spongiactinospora gelatinilytica TaxID=2666298 RepID=A0A2W2G3T1_9ACTN|nr:NAD(P)-dependent oxidoreductase [Spongiactinospora gelatinilytica]PZG35025.1 NAD(P)-dependent oxidoreductase [Spongiactinospora gelatinilytica]
MKLAMVGLGAMGGGIARRLLSSGFPLTVHNRTAAKADPLIEAGARWAAQPQDAARDSDVVMLSLSDEQAVDEVLFGRMLPVLKPGTVVIDTSTTSAAYAGAASERLAAHGVRRVELCLLGNPEMAAQGRLRLFAAGHQRDVAEVENVLAAIGEELRYLGPPGTACTMKLAFNLLLGVQTVGLAEAVALGVRSGLDRTMLINAITSSGFCSPALAFRAAFMRRESYEPAAFRARLMVKDLRLAASDARSAGLTLPVCASAAGRLDEAVAAGHGDEDAAVVVETSLGS